MTPLRPGCTARCGRQRAEAESLDLRLVRLVSVVGDCFYPPLLVFASLRESEVLVSTRRKSVERYLTGLQRCAPQTRSPEQLASHPVGAKAVRMNQGASGPPRGCYGPYPAAVALGEFSAAPGLYLERCACGASRLISSGAPTRWGSPRCSADHYPQFL